MDHPYSRGGRLRSPAEPSFSVRQEAKVDTMQPSPIQIIAQQRETFDPKIYIQPHPVDAGDLPVIHQVNEGNISHEIVSQEDSNTYQADPRPMPGLIAPLPYDDVVNADYKFK